MVIMVMFSQTQRHHALSRDTIADNMSTCLVLALKDTSTLSETVGTDCADSSP